MKALFTLFTLVFVSPAWAIYAPGWERPIKEAEMSVSDSYGTFSGVENVRLTMNKRDGAKEAATSFEVEMLFDDGRHFVQLFNVDAVEYTRCGSTFFDATAELVNPRTQVVEGTLVLSLERINPFVKSSACGGFAALPVRPALPSSPFNRQLQGETAETMKWKANLSIEWTSGNRAESALTVEGTPKDVFTIQSVTK